MAGTGAAFNHIDATLGFTPPGGPLVSVDPPGNRTNILLTLGAGLQYQLTRNWLIDAGYRYVDAGEVQNGKTGHVLFTGIPWDCSKDCSAVGTLREHRFQGQLV